MGNTIKLKFLYPIIAIFVKRIIRKFGLLTKAQFKPILKKYKEVYEDDRNNKYGVYDSIVRNSFFWYPSVRLAELRNSMGADTYFYNFSYRAPIGNVSPHAWDLSWVFGNLTTSEADEQLRLKGTKEEIKLSHQIMDAWISFAKTGDPNHANLPKWEKYDLITRKTMNFNVPCEVIESPNQRIKELFDDYYSEIFLKF